MKSLIALLLLATMAVLHHASAQRQVEPACCRNVTKITIPVNKVIDVQKTPGHCVINAFIIRTARNKFCVDPECDLMRKLRERGRI